MTREQEIEQALRALVAHHNGGGTDSPRRGGLQASWNVTPHTLTYSDLIRNAEIALLRPVR